MAAWENEGTRSRGHLFAFQYSGGSWSAYGDALRGPQDSVGIYINGKLVRAKNLVNNKNVLKKITRRVPIYNVLLNEHHKMTVNNMTVETLHPDSIK